MSVRKKRRTFLPLAMTCHSNIKQQNVTTPAGLIYPATPLFYEKINDKFICS